VVLTPQRRGSKQYDEGFTQLFESTLSYDRKLGRKLNLAALAGYSYQDFPQQWLVIQAGDFLTDVTSENLASAGDFKNSRANGSSYKNASRLVAFFGRVNLNYNDLAFLSASVRREGSTQFGENNKWGMFPAVSAVLTWVKLVDISFVSSLKFRGSYGITGALPPQSYLSLFLYGPTANNFYITGVYYPLVRTYPKCNPDLKWERKAEFDIGLDFALFNNRMTGSIDYL
jgi:iron complex outermembrane receptor protein